MRRNWRFKAEASLTSLEFALPRCSAGGTSSRRKSAAFSFVCNNNNNNRSQTGNDLDAIIQSPVSKSHCFCARRGFVEQWRVGNVKAGHLDDHSLEVQQTLQAPLRDLGLVRSVLCRPTSDNQWGWKSGGVQWSHEGVSPARVFKDVSLNSRWQKTVVITHSNVRAPDFVGRSYLIRPAQQFWLRYKREAATDRLNISRLWM